MMRDLVLCGFMGCGKSAVGRVLARRFSCQLIDMDTYIEQHAGMQIPEIFAQYGEAHFRQLEAQAVRALCGRGGRVIATGGGALLCPDNARAAREGGACIVFLNCSFLQCYRRIQNTNRPLVQNNTRAALQALYNSRLPIYQSICELSVQTRNTPTRTADSLIEALANANAPRGFAPRPIGVEVPPQTPPCKKRK